MWFRRAASFGELPSPGPGAHHTRFLEDRALPGTGVSISQLRALAQRHSVRRLDLFGSAAREEAGPRDYDFLVEFEPLPPLEPGRAYLALLQALQAAVGAPVDLVEVEALKNPYFLVQIARERVSIYAA